HEAIHGQSRKDFHAKMNIALKEASEMEYWLLLLQATDYLDDAAFKSIHTDCEELLKILVTIVKNTEEVH
ncbi:MAG: four helix bundle protein, partial [Cytophagaceae bacterium]|nr:four helix bundle protein [Cytophagaceae bacterium]